MTTNIERAAEVLRGDKHYKMGPHGEQFLTSEAARSLADAGLLMPDLPEPTFTPKSDPEWAEEYRSNWDYDPPIAAWEDANTNWWVAVFADGETSGGWSEFAEEELSLLSAEKLRGIASLMLAAATKIDQITNHTEQERA